MSGETEKEQSGWTVDTLNYFLGAEMRAIRRENEALERRLEERFDTQTVAVDKAFLAAQQATQAALAAAEKAVTKAELASDKRFDAANGFREQLNTQAARLVGKDQFDAVQQRLDDRVRELSARLDTAEGTSKGMKMSGGLLSAVLAGIAAIVVIVNVVIAIAR